jgi:uncharacterized membrane protein YfcA
MQTSEQRDRRLHELERLTPEGESPSRRVVWGELGVLAPLAIIGAVGGSIALFIVGGWMALCLGLFLVFAYYTLAWWPEIVAAVARRHEHREFLRQVDRESGAGAPAPR